MRFSDDTFSVVLLTMALSPDREEYVRPLSGPEFFRLAAKCRDTGVGSVGKLMHVDISGLMMKLGIPEEEAYRLFVLLNRGVQVSYALENFMERGIEPVTYLDEEYPSRVRSRMGEYMPPFLYVKGDSAILREPFLGVTGLSGVKTSDSARRNVELIGSEAEKLGYRLLSGDEPGVTHLAMEAARGGNPEPLAILGGGLSEYAAQHPGANAISLVHPDSPFTQAHAAERNKFLFALSDAVFVLNTDMKRGESESLSRKYCDYIYAWDGWPMNKLLISRGAAPFAELTPQSLKEMSARWAGARSEQLTFFDLM